MLQNHYYKFMCTFIYVEIVVESLHLVNLLSHKTDMALHCSIKMSWTYHDVFVGI
jgi:hypothetical protein